MEGGGGPPGPPPGPGDGGGGGNDDGEDDDRRRMYAAIREASKQEKEQSLDPLILRQKIPEKLSIGDVPKPNKFRAYKMRVRESIVNAWPDPEFAWNFP